MEKIKIDIVNESGNKLPEYKTPLSAGADLRAFVNGKGTRMIYNCFVQDDAERVILRPGGRCVIDTGQHIQLPDGYEAKIRPRSGLTLNDGIVAQLGTIDSDYTGSMGIILINFGEKQFIINNGDRLAQLVISPVVQGEFNLVDKLKKTERGDGGFGHTGV